MTLLDASEKILREAGCALDVQGLTKRIIDAGLWTPVTKTPSASVASAIYVDIKKGGKRFVKMGKGMFGLAGMSTRKNEPPSLFEYAEAQTHRPDSSRKDGDSGYVYILTNSSLKGMVKIGKTRRPVNTRSKELYNTAIPTEFVEFASLKTSKYAQVEELVHRILTKLTRKRVSEKREFYKIKPQEALEILTDVSGVLDPSDRWFHVPGQEVVVKPIRRGKQRKVAALQSTPRATPGVKGTTGMTWSGKTQLAKLIARRGGNEGAYGGILQYFVEEGAKARKQCRPGSKWRKALEDAGVRFDADSFVVDWEHAKNPL